MNTKEHKRYQSDLQWDKMFPKIDGKCRCGCGLDAEKKIRKEIITKRGKVIPAREYFDEWHNRKHENNAFFFYSYVKGFPQWFNSHLKNLQDSKCANCGADIENYAEADHDIAIVLGGTNLPRNWRLLCRECHLAKTKIDLMCLRMERSYCIKNQCFL